MISKKNIRYEGILYSINETNSTLALQNVKSYGTEGRDETDPATAFVAPQEGIHAYLLFRGCDIKDLHVHEQQQDSSDASQETSKSEKQPVDPVPTTSSTEKTSKRDMTNKKIHNPSAVPAKSSTSAPATKKESQPAGNSKKERTVSGNSTTTNSNNNNNNSQRRSATTRRNPAAVGTGASLLNRKARGTVQGGVF
ncbi:MAG: protein LSM14 [Bacillariaceae sp.]